jgi:hypothetical protein
MAEPTVWLSALAMRDPHLKAFVDNLMEKLPAIAAQTGQQLPALSLLRGALVGALVGGLNLGLRIGEARDTGETAQTAKPAPPAKEAAETSLYAWIGEDELGSGEIGIKQSQVPAGMIPMVAIKRQKMERHWPAAEQQAATYGKRIHLCRYAFAEVLKSTAHPKATSPSSQQPPTTEEKT